ncbi:MAG: MBL fold metallo-hydrolase [Deltaproteobacteria bacterium]|nr:MBL fold metallo-hydrolase [Deltaproteobacteria bacterium]
MPVTNAQTGTRIDEITDGIYRISTPVPPNPGLPAGFTFNQFLIVDDEPLMFHLGLRKLFPLVHEAVAMVMPVEKLRWLSFSHFEADECGSLDEWLAAAPNAAPLCGMIGGMVTIGDVSSRPPRMVADGETVSLGKKTVRWHDTPHIPHGWDAGLISELSTRTLFCGDLFTQPGAEHKPVTETDVLGPSVAFRAAMDYFANPTAAAARIDQLAATEPALLACMHGASYRGNGAAALRELATTLAG